MSRASHTKQNYLWPANKGRSICSCWRISQDRRVVADLSDIVTAGCLKLSASRWRRLITICFMTALRDVVAGVVCRLEFAVAIRSGSTGLETRQAAFSLSTVEEYSSQAVPGILSMGRSDGTNSGIR